ncbi:hypothetical protein SAPIO_CDS6351 [Scedosporium apiospermum]|uniref:Uncharacterized protein n=1 Tax=Pseudallescheria apiosperma TaxID=563466 RepID=A0A084G448_PSEDA|nr:uncharacterized protein SAPIO_CDS6351 [Scedosporium apiospermum]KEZ42110.1 hypothetical protein SAPIO_CDS6351 [Scedosporium apiospermum]
MHFHSAFASVVALVLFGANTSAAPVAAEVCSAIDNRFPVVTFQSWITDCGDKGGHTMGMSLVYPSLTDICLPLNSNIRGLDLLEVTEGCRITAYRSPVCDDYPYDGTTRDTVGCLWAGNEEFHSYKLTCDKLPLRQDA